MITVILDNGHGINTLGKKSPDGSILEYKYTRKLVKQLAIELMKMGVNVKILVPEDVDISLTQRIKRANNIYTSVGKKDCFLVSVHLNAASTNSWTTACGWSVFVSKNASQNSKRLARKLTDAAIVENVLGNRALPTTKYWTWNWTTNDIAILKNTNCPAVLTENMFMDNKEDVQFLLSNDGFNTLVRLHVNGIINYIAEIKSTKDI